MFDLSQLKASSAPRRKHDRLGHVLKPMHLSPPAARQDRAEGPPLPGVAQEIADVIGREQTCRLIGQLPRCLAGPMLYVPKGLAADHFLVRVLGWADAQAMVDAFGGECLKPPSCSEVYRAFRDRAIAGMLAEGLATRFIADAVGVTAHRVRQIAQGCL